MVPVILDQLNEKTELFDLVMSNFQNLTPEQVQEMRMAMPVSQMRKVGEKTNVLSIHLTKPMLYPTLYAGVVSLLMNLKSEDVAELYFHTPGGDTSIAQMLIHALQNTQAMTVGYGLGDVISAGTMVMPYCKMFCIGPDTRFMFHSTRVTGMSGKTYKIRSYSEGHMGFMQSIFQYMENIGFINSEEKARILEGVEDVYISGAVIMKRIQDKCPERLLTYADNYQPVITGGK